MPPVHKRLHIHLDTTRVRGFDGVSIYLGGEDGHIAVYDVEKHELIRVDDASKILDQVRKLKGK